MRNRFHQILRAGRWTCSEGPNPGSCSLGHVAPCARTFDSSLGDGHIQPTLFSGLVFPGASLVCLSLLIILSEVLGRCLFLFLVPLSPVQNLEGKQLEDAASASQRG